MYIRSNVAHRSLFSNFLLKISRSIFWVSTWVSLKVETWTLTLVQFFAEQNQIQNKRRLSCYVGCENVYVFRDLHMWQMILQQISHIYFGTRSFWLIFRELFKHDVLLMITYKIFAIWIHLWFISHEYKKRNILDFYSRNCSSMIDYWWSLYDVVSFLWFIQGT